MELDLLAIGDIVVEPFIRLQEAHITCKNEDDCDLCLRYGDKIPYEYAKFVPAVGNSSNAAVSASRLGLNAGLRAYVGKDHYGEQCLEVLKRENVNTDYMVQEADKATNHHYVLWFESDRTILVKHEAYDYAVPELAAAPKWIYLSSLAAHSLPYHLALIEWLKQYPDTKLAFNPGTFQMKLGLEPLKGLYERTDFFCVNKEEAERILQMPDESDIKDLLKGLHAVGPKIVSITDGTKGAYAYDGNEMLFVPMYPDQDPPFERTGAGDAFASSVCSALVLGKPLKEALLWGPVNSMFVVQKIGAQEGLVTREKMEECLANAPEAYKVSLLA